MSTIAANEYSAMVRIAPSVPASYTCRETLRVMFQHPEAKCIVVCNTDNEPVGLLMCERFFLKVTGRMGMDHFYRESVTKLMNRKPLIADISAPPESVALKASQRPEMMKNDCIIVTENGTFAGVVYASDLIH
ncbi:CBS domain-containing protein [Paenibacillus sp. S150]|uniref:CBS domain-containing protein n=1 Tax=Paenibacillus sp. S150 TaxID=2749826 RepID=UPI001C59DA9E|nr:CBS domain-containing protein [Paenibacillus sp. S150]MBW4081627.1 CBS domain-containing protein [Paenibacillus sp. S150]